MDLEHGLHASQRYHVQRCSRIDRRQPRIDHVGVLFVHRHDDPQAGSPLAHRADRLEATQVRSHEKRPLTRGKVLLDE